MTCLPCSRGTRLTGGKACLATAAGTLDQRLKCGRADPSLALGRGRPGGGGVPVTSTDDCDRDQNENRICTTSDAQHYKRREHIFDWSDCNCDVRILLFRRIRYVRGLTHNSSSPHSHGICGTQDVRASDTTGGRNFHCRLLPRAHMMGRRQKRKQNARCARATCCT